MDIKPTVALAPGSLTPKTWEGTPHPSVKEPESMKLLLVGLVLVLAAGAQAQWYNFPREAYLGARDMWRAYSDMKEANWKTSDKYFHARGNYDAAGRGPGGKWAAGIIR
ncbi:serum amyloid A-5 protein-like [Arapaima gigas]